MQSESQYIYRAYCNSVQPTCDSNWSLCLITDYASDDPCPRCSVEDMGHTAQIQDSLHRQSRQRCSNHNQVRSNYNSEQTITSPVELYVLPTERLRRECMRHRGLIDHVRRFLASLNAADFELLVGEVRNRICDDREPWRSIRCIVSTWAIVFLTGSNTSHPNRCPSWNSQHRLNFMTCIIKFRDVLVLPVSKVSLTRPCFRGRLGLYHAAPWTTYNASNWPGWNKGRDDVRWITPIFVLYARYRFSLARNPYASANHTQGVTCTAALYQVTRMPLQ